MTIILCHRALLAPLFIASLRTRAVLHRVTIDQRERGMCSATRIGDINGSSVTFTGVNRLSTAWRTRAGLIARRGIKWRHMASSSNQHGGARHYDNLAAQRWRAWRNAASSISAWFIMAAHQHLSCAACARRKRCARLVLNMAAVSLSSLSIS